MDKNDLASTSNGEDKHQRRGKAKFQPNSSTEDKHDQCKDLVIEIKENLEPAPECCIYRIPKDLRNINAEAYTPRIISIGPFHNGKQELSDMEKEKKRYLQKFSERIGVEKLEIFKAFVISKEQSIRFSYEETSKLQSLEFVTMILYDAVFIVELFLKNYHDDKSEFLLSKPWLRLAIIQDLQLLENQLPFFVLEELYRLMLATPNPDVKEYPSSFLNLSCRFFRDILNSGIGDQPGVKHFVDLRRHSLVKTHATARKEGHIRNLPGAVKLHESGVKFKCTSGQFLLDVKFEGTKLQIPRFEVDDCTECLIRNLMALEQCHYPLETHVCNYIILMKHLTNTERDIDLLVEKGIISNFLGDNAALAQMLNKLWLQITPSNSCYYDIGSDLKAHYKNPWNHARATLKMVYFNNLWRGTATVAAVILLLLTSIQTICSIIALKMG